ncbi:serine serine/threonine-protein phosphatase 4 regulatory subunit 2 [Solea senegalensis]|uniref:Serine serine/threonine-protein phosphatase 4 regulatory subunit 2 n=1 Tax=Solea senegalensis TaxID=28829 RepID=A0AAV6QPN9_SOLSE|nr:serine/threonine-protein phosphatase 4 regulatory subunit 2-B [Solea senegalensis]KAG7494680.1 serine serine/threonine-protein phosphatase 4 regulatory subunit 2 [Solea senegalensis]
MEIDSLQEALRDFDKKSKKEACPLLEQFLCHVAKTGETMVQWSQFKSYFLFKLEKVMDDFRASAPEQRGPANPNVESIPFDDMKERILKIVNGYNGIPFTIQRLCELLTEPKRNYTGTDKFLRGVEKNVMVVSCVHPNSEKNGCSAVNRMNGVMLPGNTSAFTERKVNGPGTPRPLNRPKLSLATSLAANGLPDSTDGKDLNPEQDGEEDTSEVSASEASLGSSVKNKHPDTEEDMEAEQLEVKRLKFTKEDEDEEDEDDEEEEQEVDSPRPSHASCLSKEAEAMVQEEEEEEDEEEEEKVGYSKENEASSSAAATEDQEPTSSTQAEVCSGSGEELEQAEREVPCGSQDEANDMDQTEQQAPAGVLESPETSRDSEESNSDPVSSSSSSSSSGSSCSIEDGAEAGREDVALAPSSSTTEPPTEAAMESATSNTGTTEEPMEQD